MEHVRVAIYEYGGERKWVRLVVDWAWPHPHAGNAGCRSDDEDDMVGVHD